MLDDSHPLPNQGQSQPASVVNTSSKSLTASEPLAESSNHVRSDDVNQSGHVTYQPPARVVRKVAAMSLILCGLATILMMVTGGMSEAESPLLISVVALWAVSKLTITIKRQRSQARFVQKEVRLRKIKKTTLQSPPAVPGTPGNDTSHSLQQSNQNLATSALPSDASVQRNSPSPSSTSLRPVSISEQRSTAREGQVEFGPPGRVDTEADIGLVPLTRRKTFPPPRNEQS